MAVVEEDDLGNFVLNLFGTEVPHSVMGMTRMMETTVISCTGMT